MLAQPNIKFSDHSQTNNLVKGVDEPDIAKTDGTYIYTISNDSIFSIIQAYPAQHAQILLTIDLGDNNFQGILLEGNYVCLIGSNSNNSLQYVQIYDVSNKKYPILHQTITMQGNSIGARLINGYAYFYTNNELTLLEDGKISWPWIDFGEGRTRVPLKQIYYYPQDLQNPMRMITAINLRSLNKEQQNAIVVLLSNNNDVFISKTSIYLISLIHSPIHYDQTSIKRVFINGTKMLPSGVGIVPHWFQNYFYFSTVDQYGSYFRIVTRDIDSEQYSLFILDFNMQLYGFLGNIGNINLKKPVVRFSGPKLYFVDNKWDETFTFKIINLENPRTPEIVGEIDCPGFVNSLYQYDFQTLIAVTYTQLKSDYFQSLSLVFLNVSRSPKQISRYTYNFQQAGNSTLYFSYKQFLYSKERNMLVIPVQIYKNKMLQFGAFAFQVGKDMKKIDLTKDIKHGVGLMKRPQRNKVTNLFYIGEFLYTKSDCLLRINHINHNYNDFKNITILCGKVQSQQKEIVEKGITIQIK